MSSTQEGWLIAALDAIAQFRASKEPLKNVVKRIAIQRRLGPRERAKMGDAVFAWSRLQGLSVETGVARPTHRQIDEAIIRKWQKGETSQELQFPAWFKTKIQKTYNDEAEELLVSLQQRARPCLAVDIREITVDEVCEALDTLKIAHERWELFPEALCIEQDRFRVEALPRRIRDCVWLMDAASQFAANLALPAKREKILDACAGAGGKTLFLASRGAEIVAMDVSLRRLSQAQKRCATLVGGDSLKISFVVGDGTNPPFETYSFQHILLDAPCTGTGTLRRAPDLLLRLSEEAVSFYVKTQRELIHGMHKILKPQGILTYATCSIFSEENTEQVAFAVKEFGFKLLSERQLLPSRDNCDGFYVAKLQKTGD